MRTTIKQVEGRAEMVNHALEARGSTRRVFVQGRNGATAIDLTDTDGTVVSMLHIGTRGEAYHYLRAMTEALWALDAS